MRKFIIAGVAAIAMAVGGRGRGADREMRRPYRFVPCDKGSKHCVDFSDNPDAIPERADCPFCGKNVSVTLIFPVPGKIGLYGGRLRAHNTDQRVYL